MTAQAYHDMNVVLRRLDDAISHHRYADDRGGIIPPASIPLAIADVADALATLQSLTAEAQQGSKVRQIRGAA